LLDASAALLFACQNTLWSEKNCVYSPAYFAGPLHDLQLRILGIFYKDDGEEKNDVWRPFARRLAVIST
jgi:hypothetical protein